MSRHREGRAEAILEPGLAIIDAHHHLFVRPALRYLLADYLEDVNAGHRIIASVYVETRAMARIDGPELLRPVGEVEFANGVAAMCASGAFGKCQVAAAIVGFADLSLGDRVAETLDRSMAVAADRFRGVRQMALSHPDPSVLRSLSPPLHADLLKSPGFGQGLRQLARRGLSFDAAVFHHQLPELSQHVAAHPDVIFVLNHLGMAMAPPQDTGRRQEVFLAWRDAMHALARHENVVCKVGGLGLPFWGFGFDSRARPAAYEELSAAWKPYVDVAIDAFGVDRCMMESDYPPDGISCGFVPLWNALKHIVRGCSDDEKAALFHRTAAKTYRIQLPHFAT